MGGGTRDRDKDSNWRAPFHQDLRRTIHLSRAISDPAPQLWEPDSGDPFCRKSSGDRFRSQLVPEWRCCSGACHSFTNCRQLCITFAPFEWGPFMRNIEKKGLLFKSRWTREKVLVNSHQKALIDQGSNFGNFWHFWSPVSCADGFQSPRLLKAIFKLLY